MLIFEHLSVGYGGRHGRIVQRDLSGTLPDGALVALVGNNGTGKSTLLRTLAGLLPPLAGRVLLDGTDVYALAPRERAKRLAVVLPPQAAPPSLPVREVVSLGRIPYEHPLHGIWRKTSAGRAKTSARSAKTTASCAETESIVEESLRLCDAGELSDRDFSTLSDGERQRVRLAVALVQDTPVILLDEPTAFLDHSTRLRIFSLLRRLADERHKSILFSTHDLPLLPGIHAEVWTMQAEGLLIH